MLHFIKIATSNGSECIDGSLQLVGGPTLYEGRIEVCANGVWGSVCPGYGNRWSSLSTSVVCRQLGRPSIGNEIICFVQHHMLHCYSLGIPGYSYSLQYGIGSGPVWLHNIECTGDEFNLLDCPSVHSDSAYGYYSICDHYNDASVICPGKYS